MYIMFMQLFQDLITFTPPTIDYRTEAGGGGVTFLWQDLLY